MHRTPIFIFTALLALHFGASVSALPSSTAPTLDERPVRVLQVSEGPRVLPGVARPRQSVTLGASFDSQVLEVLVEEGQRVVKDQAIARLDDRVARASLALARHEANQRARLERARLEMLQAQRVLKRVQAAGERGAANAEEITAAQTDAELAQADVNEATELIAAAELRRIQAEAQLERHIIRAPFDGVVVRLPLEGGAIVQSGDAIAELADIDALATDLYLPAAVASDIAAGQRYALQFHEPTDRVYWGTVRFVEPRIEPTSGTVRVAFDVPVPPGAALAGTLITPATREPTQAEMAAMRGAEPVLAIESDDG